MALIRCPGCKNDTSDSLAHCPNCGAPLRGSGPGLFERGGAATEAPMPVAASESPRDSSSAYAASTVAATLDAASRAGAGAPWSARTKAIAFVVALFSFAFVPHALPLAIVLGILWVIMKRKRGTFGPGQKEVEALRILVNEVRRPRTQSSTERPLERMRRLEGQLKARRNS